MNYKADIPIYKNQEYLTEQLTVLFDPDMYKRIEKLSCDLDISMNTVIRTLLNHALKHCNIEVEQGDTCKNCACYLSDDKGNYVCCNEQSKYFASFRLSDSWCGHHTRR